MAHASYPRIPKEQRKRILERDGNRCVICWRRYGLDVHDYFDDPANPILPPSPPLKVQYPYLSRRDFELVTLCDSCHGKIGVCDKYSPLYRILIQIVKTNYALAKLAQIEFDDKIRSSWISGEDCNEECVLFRKGDCDTTRQDGKCDREFTPKSIDELEESGMSYPSYWREVTQRSKNST